MYVATSYPTDRPSNWPLSWFDPFLTTTTLNEAQVIPDKHFGAGARIKPLPFANGNGRYITVAPERTLAPVEVEVWVLHTCTPAT
jgi:hypothetical protein